MRPLWCRMMWGGRFSVLTAVGLLPIAVSGADILKLMEGAASGRKQALENDFEHNDAMQYAAISQHSAQKRKDDRDPGQL